MALRGVRTAVATVAVASLIGVAACSPTPSPSPSSLDLPSSPIPSPDLATPSAAPSTGPATVEHDGPLASSGSIVVLGNQGALSLVDSDGRSSLLASADEGLYFLPAWSPDGSQIAVVRFGSPNRSILVFDAGQAASGGAAEPTMIFESSTIAPFYLSWTPDGERVSFLADEAGSLSLRLAPADGSAPLDGTGPGATIRTGAPLYFDWIERDLLLAHIGTGTGALLGEIGLDGEEAVPAVESPGDFRSAVVSADRRFISYVHTVGSEKSEVVVAARDGSSEHAVPVFGLAALAFDPTGNMLASIGPSEAAQSSVGVPIGPLRLIDAQSGETRTLLDGSVAGFWWSPDGKTIAALRIQPVEGPASAASPLPSPSSQAREVRLLFVDVATAEIDAQVVVRPGQLFVDQLLSYFDQYALSHHLWAPDSSSILIPVVTADGQTTVAVMYRNGDPPATIAGQMGFWSP
jgi:WD40 repeat protein